MKKFWKVIVLVVVLAVIVPVFAACGGNGGTGDTGPPSHNDPTNGQGENPRDENVGDNFGETDWSRYPIIINGRGITANFHTAEGEDFPTHVPLAAVAEVLGSAVNHSETGEVTLSGLRGEIAFVVGSHDFYVDGEAVSLWQPAISVDGNVYVPIPFFREVFGMGNSSWLGGHIYIDTYATDDMH